MSLLAPQDRLLYLESLRPPDGYRLERAVGTTYTLDLLSLLVTPLGFTLFDLDFDKVDIRRSDPLELLEAIRGHADRITLFCQAGRISVPSRHRLLFASLESRVVEAVAPKAKQAFHPKLWVLKYASEEGAPRYRVLCLSRNLTFDRSWDTILILEGALRQDRVRGFPRSRPLSEFLRALPGMAVRALDPEMTSVLDLMAREVELVDFDIPAPFDEFAFWPLGHSESANRDFHRRIDAPKHRSLVAAPFLSTWTLNRLAGERGPNVLISRQASLHAMPDSALDHYDELHAFTSRETLHEQTDGEESTSGAIEAQGFHAKLFVLEKGKATSLFTGSANATVSALEGNVEFMVELIGRRTQIGIDLLMSRQPGVTNFADLLERYVRLEEPITPDEDVAKLDADLDEIRLALSSVPWTAQVEVLDGDPVHALVIAPDQEPSRFDDQFTVTCRPLSLMEDVALQVGPAAGWSARFHPVAFASLTSFIVFTVHGSRGRHSRQASFVVNAKLMGAPADRKGKLLRHLLQDRAAVVRFLFLLLADLSDDPSLSMNSNGTGEWGNRRDGAQSTALLEAMLRALDRDEGRLSAVQRLLADLKSEGEGGADLIPEGLPELFQAIWSARRGVET